MVLLPVITGIVLLPVTTGIVLLPVTSSIALLPVTTSIVLLPVTTGIVLLPVITVQVHLSSHEHHRVLASSARHRGQSGTSDTYFLQIQLDPGRKRVNFMKLLRVFGMCLCEFSDSCVTFPGLWILFYTLKASIKDLLLLLLFVSVGMLISSSLIYFAEHMEMETKFGQHPQVLLVVGHHHDNGGATATWYRQRTGASSSEQPPASQGFSRIGFTVPVLVNNFVLCYIHTTSTIRREEERKQLAGGESPSGHLHGNALSSHMLDDAVLGLQL
ncbi:hypothetical protein Btru_020474 [Bulinus truncatus]|nr:hypothetical protein Btru_020474 [Bulinus truncatus]